MQEYNNTSAEEEALFCFVICDKEDEFGKSCLVKSKGCSFLFLRFLHEKKPVDENWAFTCWDAFVED